MRGAPFPPSLRTLLGAPPWLFSSVSAGPPWGCRSAVLRGCPRQCGPSRGSRFPPWVRTGGAPAAFGACGPALGAPAFPRPPGLPLARCHRVPRGEGVCGRLRRCWATCPRREGRTRYRGGPGPQNTRGSAGVCPASRRDRPVCEGASSRGGRGCPGGISVSQRSPGARAAFPAQPLPSAPAAPGVRRGRGPAPLRCAPGAAAGPAGCAYQGASTFRGLARSRSALTWKSPSCALVNGQGRSLSA